MLQDELSVAMALVGITDLGQVRKGLVNTRDLDALVPRDDDDGDGDGDGDGGKKKGRREVKL